MSPVRTMSRCIAVVMIAVMAFATYPATMAQAGMISTDQAIADVHGDDRERILDFMSRGDVRAEMQALGVDPAEAEARVLAMSEAEIQQVAGQLGDLPAGEGVGAVIGVFAVVFLVLLFTDIMGLTNVFTFVR